MAWVLNNNTLAAYAATATPSLTITEPVENRLMVCAIAARDNANLVDPAVTSFTGWTALGSQSLSSGADASCFLYYRLAPASFGTTISTLTLDRACNGVLAYASFSGNHTTFTNATAAVGENTSSTTSLTVGPVTPVVGDELVLYVVYGHNGWGGTSPYVSWTTGSRIADEHSSSNAGLGWAWTAATDTSGYSSTASWTTTRQSMEIAAIFDAAAAVAVTQIGALGLDHRPRIALGTTTGKPAAPAAGGLGSMTMSLDIRV